MIDDQCSESLTLHFHSHDENRPAGLGHLFEERDHVLHQADLAIAEQHQRVLEHRFHLGGGWPVVGGGAHLHDVVAGGRHRAVRLVLLRPLALHLQLAECHQGVGSGGQIVGREQRHLRTEFSGKRGARVRRYAGDVPRTKQS